MKFYLSLYDLITDERIGPAIHTNVQPAQDMILFHHGSGWRVVAMQVHFPHPDSHAARHQEPEMIDVLVSKTEGIFTR